MATAESHEQRSMFSSAQSVAQLFRMRAGIESSRTAARRKAKGAWQDVTWAQLLQESEDAAWGLIALGVKNVRDGGLYSLHLDDPFGYDVQISGLANNALTDK